MAKFCIELDCAPGQPRPGDLIKDVLEGTGIELGEPVVKFYGCWEWEIPEDMEKPFLEHREKIKEKIVVLYQTGFIRYGSW